MLNHIKGALVGFAIGDAMGATTEFMTKDEIVRKYGKVKDIIGGGHWGLKPGDVTDDTEMTVAVIKGIMENSLDPIEEIGKQFLHWKDTDPVDIGITIRSVFTHYRGDWYKAAEEVHHHLDGKSGGNGSLMRCLPIALAYSDKEKIKDISLRQSKMTHYDDVAAEACILYNMIAKRVLEGESLEQAILTEIKGTIYDLSYDVEPDCNPSGYVVHTLKWVFYWLLNSSTFEEVVVGATNAGDDSDTIAAIAGGLKGLEVGYDNLPLNLRNHVTCERDLHAYAEILNLIRDKDTVELKKDLERIHIELEKSAIQLCEIYVEELAMERAESKPNDYTASEEKKEELLSLIKDNIYLCRLSFTDKDHDFTEKLNTWQGVLIRYRRTKRLIELGAPKIINVNECRWLRIMIEHLTTRYQGGQPQFTQEQLEELEQLRIIEEGFEG